LEQGWFEQPYLGAQERIPSLDSGYFLAALTSLSAAYPQTPAVWKNTTTAAYVRLLFFVFDGSEQEITSARI